MRARTDKLQNAIDSIEFFVFLFMVPLVLYNMGASANAIMGEQSTGIKVIVILSSLFVFLVFYKTAVAVFSSYMSWKRFVRLTEGSDRVIAYVPARGGYFAVTLSDEFSKEIIDSVRSLSEK